MSKNWLKNLLLIFCVYASAADSSKIQQLLVTKYIYEASLTTNAETNIFSLSIKCITTHVRIAISFDTVPPLFLPALFQKARKIYFEQLAQIRLQFLITRNLHSSQSFQPPSQFQLPEFINHLTPVGHNDVPLADKSFRELPALTL